MTHPPAYRMARPFVAALARAMTLADTTLLLLWTEVWSASLQGRYCPPGWSTGTQP